MLLMDRRPKHFGYLNHFVLRERTLEGKQQTLICSQIYRAVLRIGYTHTNSLVRSLYKTISLYKKYVANSGVSSHYYYNIEVANAFAKGCTLRISYLYYTLQSMATSAKSYFNYYKRWKTNILTLIN